MGTSQSLNPKRNTPQWQEVKQKLQPIIDPQKLQDDNRKREYLRAFCSAVNPHKGSSKAVFGNAGRKVITNFLSFATNAQHLGVEKAFLALGVSIKWSELSVDDFVNTLLASCSSGDARLDETAANSALNRLLKDILSDVNNVTDLDEVFSNQSNDIINERLAVYFAYYIIEFSEEMFSAYIYEKGGNRAEISQQLFDYTKRSLLAEDMIGSPVTAIDWAGEQGESVIKQYQQRLIDIWQ